MLGLLALGVLLTIVGAHDFDEPTYELLLREQGFSDDDIEIFLQEFREARSAPVEEEEFVHWWDARGYRECPEYKRTTCGEHGHRGVCTGCLKPRLLSKICEEYDCPPMEDLNVGGCGFQARKMLSANWAVTPINTLDGDHGYMDAYWRIFKYINKANSQGVRLAKNGYAIFSTLLDENHKVISGEMAYYIPNAYQADPPAPTDSLVTVESWDDVTTYDRAFGGHRENDPKFMKKQFKYLKAALRKQNITPYKYTLMKYHYIGPGCGQQRNEVMLLDDGPM